MVPQRSVFASPIRLSSSSCATFWLGDLEWVPSPHFNKIEVIILEVQGDSGLWKVPTQCLAHRADILFSTGSLIRAALRERALCQTLSARGTEWVLATSRTNRSGDTSQLLRTPHCPSLEPQTSFTDTCHVQKDSHLLVHIQHLTLVKYALPGPLGKVKSLLVPAFMTIAFTEVTAPHLYSTLLLQEISSPLCCCIPVHALLLPSFSPCKYYCYSPPGYHCWFPPSSLWSFPSIDA